MRYNILLGGLVLLCPVAAAACPVISTGVTEIQLSQTDLNGSYRTSVVAGGSQDLSQCGYAAGYVIQQPDFSFYLSDYSGPMQVSVESPGCDTVLLVNTPTGTWAYDDDSAGGLQPTMGIEVTPGRLDVWVGTYNGDYCSAEVVLN